MRSQLKATNLSLDEDAVARGQRYARSQGTNLSRLVSAFLGTLPDDGERSVRVNLLGPPVRRLYGVAGGGSESEDHDGRSDRDRYRSHLADKYLTDK